jgi:hypothetical protein
MPLVLRKLNSRTQWDRDAYAPWVPPDELPADALGELESEENTLSVWHVEDDRSNLGAVLAAVVSTADNLRAVDYAILEVAKVEALGIKLQSTDGDSHDHAANENWHRDMIQLTASQILSLAKLISNTETDRQRMPKRDVATSVATSVAAGRIEHAKLADSVRRAVGNPPAQ